MRTAMPTIRNHLQRIHGRCLDAIEEEVRNCESLRKLYSDHIGNAMHPADSREVHVQSALFVGLRSAGYFTFAGGAYERPGKNRRQIDLAIWLPDALRWFYLEVKPCWQQGGCSAVIADAEKLAHDTPDDPRDHLRGVLAYGFKYATKGPDRYSTKFEEITARLRPLHFEPIAVETRDLKGDYSYVQVGLWATGLE